MSHHSRRRSSKDRDSDESPRKHSSSNSHDYKEMYRDLREQYKTKKKRVGELEELLEEEKKECKKSKVDTQELWKIYYTLQKELTESYEKTSRLQAEKSKLSKELCEAKIGAAENCSATLKIALVNMQKEKQETSLKFNTIVIENKKLKEKAINYEPKINQLESIKQAMKDAIELANNVKMQVKQTNETIDSEKQKRSDIEELRRWNNLLQLESIEKERKIAELSTVDEKYTEYHSQISSLKRKLQEKEHKIKEIRIDHSKMTSGIIAPIKESLETLKQLKMDYIWSGNAAKVQLNKVNQTLNAFDHKLRDFRQKKMGCEISQKTKSSVDVDVDVSISSTSLNIPLIEQSCEVSQSSQLNEETLVLA